MKTDKPLKYLVDKGFTPPYRRWLTLRWYHIYRPETGQIEPPVLKTQVNYENTVESVYYIVEYMNRQEEPFDGFAAFSMGICQMQAVYKSY